MPLYNSKHSADSCEGLFVRHIDGIDQNIQSEFLKNTANTWLSKLNEDQIKTRYCGYYFLVAYL